jgi:hypothetical protein
MRATLAQERIQDYSGKVKEADVLGDGRAWTTGTYRFIVNDKDGKSEQARGNWIDMLGQEGNEWKVIFQAYAGTPASPSEACGSGICLFVLIRAGPGRAWIKVQQ